MLTSFTLISGIKKNTGCNVWRGWERILGGRQDWGNYPLMLHQTNDERGGGRTRGKRKLCRGSHRLQGWERRRKVLRQEETGGLEEEKRDKQRGDWAKLEGFLCKSQWINKVKLIKSKRGWRKQAHKCWLYSSHLFSGAFQPCPSSDIQFQPAPLSPPLTLPPSFCCLSNLSPLLSPHAFSPAPPPPSPHTFSHLSLSLHTFCISLSLSLITSPLPSLPVFPLLTAGTVQISLWATVRQIGGEKGALLTLKARL